MKAGIIFFFTTVLVLLVSCNQETNKKPLFTLMEKTGINFQNNVEDGSKDNSFLFRNFYNGGGVAIGDINNDGLLMFSLPPMRVTINYTSIKEIFNLKIFLKKQVSLKMINGIPVLYLLM